MEENEKFPGVDLNKLDNARSFLSIAFKISW